MSERIYCSFCGKGEGDVPTIIAGPSVWICNECISLCDDICREKVEGYAEQRAAQIKCLTLSQ